MVNTKVTTALYLVRHAQSHPNVDEDHSMWPLSDLGKQQAAALSPLLSSLNIEKLYCSPYLRCRQTIEPFATKLGTDVLINEDLRERTISTGIIRHFDEVWARSW